MSCNFFQLFPTTRKKCLLVSFPILSVVSSTLNDMVHYIRFLKTPRIAQGKQLSLSTLFTITTDLGETFLSVEVVVNISVLAAASDKIITQKSITWHQWDREVSVAFDKLDSSLRGQSVRIRVGVVDSLPEDGGNISDQIGLSRILEAWSAPLIVLPHSISAPLVQRKFQLNSNQRLEIWEETGNSIALHIWDAAIGFLANLRHDKSTCDIPQKCCFSCLINGMGRPTRVLELGSGCGIVGIALATIFQDLQITLTDLPDAMEIMKRNVSLCQPARGSLIEHLVFDWDGGLPDQLSSDIDVVVISDCTYNADVMPSLVKVLSRIMKRRHESEEIFFQLMSKSFHQMESMKSPLPHVPSGQDTSEPSFELYYYQLES